MKYKDVLTNGDEGNLNLRMHIMEYLLFNNAKFDIHLHTFTNMKIS